MTTLPPTPIIVVDDEKSALGDFLSQIVTVEEVAATFFKDNEEGILSFVENNPVTCAFLDINMPRINGTELAKKIIRIRKDIKIVFVTGYASDEESLRQTFKDNLGGIIYKPYSRDDLLCFLETLFSIPVLIEFNFRGYFSASVNHRIITFLSRKSQELLALLYCNQGKTVSMEYVIDRLWPHYNPPDLAKRLYRDATFKLRKVLEEHGISSLVSFYRGSLCLNPKAYPIHTDLSSVSKDGPFLETYPWNKEFQQ
ncbi:MAG: response regulator [Candidatus Enteromonas sp.]|nr:response regulator [Candidatus Enteromonas sp.]